MYREIAARFSPPVVCIHFGHVTELLSASILASFFYKVRVHGKGLHASFLYSMFTIRYVCPTSPHQSLLFSSSMSKGWEKYPMLELIRVSCLLSHETTCASGMSLFLASLPLPLTLLSRFCCPLIIAYLACAPCATCVRIFNSATTTLPMPTAFSEIRKAPAHVHQLTQTPIEIAYRRRKRSFI